MSDQTHPSMSIANPHPPHLDSRQKLFSGLGILGLLILVFPMAGNDLSNPGMWLTASLLLMAAGVFGYSMHTYLHHPAGIKNDGNFFSSIAHRGLWGWSVGILLTGFYILLYFYPQSLGLGADGAQNTGIVALFDPLSMAVKGQAASQWFLYGTLYTLAILIFGFKFILKYRHNRYQIIRTVSVMFFQLFFAFLIPEIMESLNADLAAKWFDKDLKNMWPLDYDFFDQWHIDNMSASGVMGTIFLIFGLLMVFVVSPILTYKFGKRWYCSWVCGCGGLAETAGDPFRHLSNKSLRAWKVERWLIHGVLLFSVIMTTAVVYGYLGEGEEYWLTRTSFTWLVIFLLILVAFVFHHFMKRKQKNSRDVALLTTGTIAVVVAVLLINYFSGSGNAFFIDNYSLRHFYGFLIGAVFSGVIGVGFYPIMGSRVWCRFGCPMAAILGIQQRFLSKFRITTNGGQCISCGNCSTYCEMGIDVRAYAQKGQNIVRASCVGCGVCSAVCPRGVLRLENGKADIDMRTDVMDSGYF